MPKHSVPNRDNRPLRKTLTIAAVSASLVFGPVLIAAPAAFGAEPIAADSAAAATPEAEAAPALVEATPAEATPPVAAAEETVPAEAAPAEEVPAEPAPAESAPVEEAVVVDVLPDAAAQAGAAAAPAAPTAGFAVLFAALAFELTAPAEGAVTNDFANLVFFDGFGTSDNTVTVTYVNAAGATTVAGAGTVDADGVFAILTNFGELAGGQTDVSVIVTQTDTAGLIVGAPILRNFSFVNPPVAAAPFTVTSPAQGSTVTTTTPTFTGTGTPGDSVVIQYTNVALEDAIAGETIIAADGTFSVVTNFLGLAPGAVEVRTLTSGFSPAGVEVVTGRIATLFFFETAPVFAPNAASITIQPDSITVSDVTDPALGVQLSATGFERNETLTTSVVDSAGVAATLSVAPAATADATGSITAGLVLTGTVAPGEYTVTVAGTTSGLEQTAVFTVIADPVPVVPAVPAAPAAVDVVALTPPVAAITGVTTLAQTGTDQSVLWGVSGLAALLTLAGGAILVLRRRIVLGLMRG